MLNQFQNIINFLFHVGGLQINVSFEKCVTIALQASHGILIYGSILQVISRHFVIPRADIVMIVKK